MADRTTNSHDDVVIALRLAAAALQVVAKEIVGSERRVIDFTGAWANLPSMSVGEILDRANAALGPYSKEAV